MSDHHQPNFRDHDTGSPAPLIPAIEEMIRQRAEELEVERPRQRLIVASSLGSVAVAAACAALVLLLGPSPGTGLLSPRQAVAAAIQTLEGDGVLHWVRRGDLIESPEQRDRPGTRVDDDWIDLKTGDARWSISAYPRGHPTPRRTISWSSSGEVWTAIIPDDRVLAVKRVPISARVRYASGSPLGDVNRILRLAADGKVPIERSEPDAGRPLVVITERQTRVERRIWITRDDEPQILRTQVTFHSRNAPRPIVTTTRTESWRILPRTPATLAKIEPPKSARRIR